MTNLLMEGTYRGFKLDPFQLEAIEHIEAGLSVLVSAPTGVGKTLIADYLIEKTYREGKQVVYTAPIKALSNQKFKEFKRLLGEDQVGILTGDVVINQDAPVMIMTTEIFRNLLHLDPGRLAHVAYVIFDEIHYIDDPERGSVWEESLIFMPSTMRFLGLSATIPNVDELAAWIGQIHQQEIKIVRHHQRAVPLEHRLFEINRGLCTRKQLLAYYRRQKAKGAKFESTTHLDLLDYIGPGYLPCLFFMFSRRKCEQAARELGQSQDFLDYREKMDIRKVVDEVTMRYPPGVRGRGKELLDLWQKGIAFHHAGLLPVVKDVVEELFERRLLKIIYCTETFAVGLNFPCRTVCFESLTKWDGEVFRPLANREYFQMAGRAGRRGIDEEGFVFSLIDLKYFQPEELPSLREEDVEPLRSRFALSYNSVLNLVRKYDEEEINRILQQNFASFQNQLERRRAEDRVEAIKVRWAKERYCAARGRPECPVGDRQLARKLEDLQKAMGSLGKKRRDRRQRALLRRDIARLEKRLAGSRKKCSPKQVEHCRKWNKQWLRDQRELEVLLEQLDQMEAPERYRLEFAAKKALLQELDYLRGDEFTARGEFASRIQVQELLVTELFFAGIFHEYTIDEINGLVAGIDYEPRRGEFRRPQRAVNLAPVTKLVRYLQDLETNFTGGTSVRFHDHPVLLAYNWSRGVPFGELLEGSGIDEGDLVYSLRRGIDVLRQIRSAAAEDRILSAKLQACIERMDRDEVAIVL
ncbi:MAG: DEAD/DEAH box helicase [Limnochordia bacterium]